MPKAYTHWKHPDEEILWIGQPQKWPMFWKQAMGMAGVLGLSLAGPGIYLLYGYFATEKVSVWQAFTISAVIFIIYIIRLVTFSVRDRYFFITSKRVLFFKRLSRQDCTNVQLESIIAVKIEPSGFDHIYHAETISIDIGRMVEDSDGKPVKEYDYIDSVADAQTAFRLLKELTAGNKSNIVT